MPSMAWWNLVFPPEQRLTWVLEILSRHGNDDTNLHVRSGNPKVDVSVTPH